jgi:hypothetical protein
MTESAPVSRHEAKREEIFERIEKKVETIEELRSFAEANGKLPPEELKVLCAQKLDEIKAKFPQKTDLLADYKRKELELAEMRSKISLPESEDEIEESDLDNFEKEDELESYLYQLSEEDTEISFLLRVEEFFVNLVKKREELLAWQELYETDKGAFFDKILPALKFDEEALPELEVAPIIWGDYSLSLSLPPAFLAVIMRGKVEGIHFRDTVINIISEETDFDKTLRHENNHNLEEMFGRERNLYAGEIGHGLEAKIERLDRLKELRAPKIFIEKEINGIKRFISDYCYKNFHEIVADIDNLEEREIHTFLANFYKIFKEIRRALGKIDDSELRISIEEGLEEVQGKFIEILKTIGNMFFAAKEMGDAGKAKASLILFEAKKIDKAVKYLSWHFGPQFDFLYSLRPVLQGEAYFPVVDKRRGRVVENDIFAAIFGESDLLSQGQSFDLALARETGPDSFFELNNIRRLSEALKADENLKLGEGDKEKFGGILSGFPFRKISSLKIEDFLEFVEKLFFVSKRLDIPELEVFALDRSPYQYFASKIYESIESDNFTEAIEIFKRWPYSQDVLISVLRDEIFSFSSDYKPLQSQELTPEKLRETNLWSFYESLGQQELLENMNSN